MLMSGAMFSYDDPAATDKIDILDIAQPLSNVCRFAAPGTCQLPSPLRGASPVTNPGASVLQSLIRSVLRSPHDREWTLQGFGMLRTYLDPDKITRLHVWTDKYATDKVSTIHTHPWDFQSMVIAGLIKDVEYERAPDGKKAMLEQQILCGEGGGLKGDPIEVRLQMLRAQTLTTGDIYEHKAADIHESRPADGTVSMIIRRFGEDVDHASVFWNKRESWVSAEPRPATWFEVHEITNNALKLWF
jgi:hypothetical protein